MDYAYFGSSTIWPVTSTIASVAGVLLIFGQQAGIGAKAVADLAADDFRRLLACLFQPWVACVALLALPLAIPQSPFLSTLRGLARLESEIDLARADGYYEELNRSPTDHRKPLLAERPSGRKSFTESGLLDEVADYRRRVLRPNLDARWNDKAFRTNSLGHRGPEISLQKPPGTFRVVLLGSSNSMGHGVEDDETYARKLEAWLNERVGKGRRVEVVNLAVSGDSPTQQWLRLRLEVPQLDPDWILSDITALDFSLEEQHLRWVLAKQPEIPFNFVKEALEASKVTTDDSTDAFHKKMSPYLKPMLDRTFAGWAAEAQKIGVPFTVVILPRADSKTESPSLFQLFRDLADRHDLPYVDLSDAFDRFELDEFRIAPWDHHPNALGHRLIFERLRDLLIVDPEFWDKIRSSSASE
jgi:lysophospholipase L1-like esterase